MQRCKYLDDLGLSVEEYGTNFVSDNDLRRAIWRKEQEIYGFDVRETWNLNISFIEWVYTRIMMFKECAIIDMDFYKIDYQGNKITQGQALDKILELAKSILLKDYYENDYGKVLNDNTNEICDLLKKVLPYMWW